MAQMAGTINGNGNDKTSLRDILRILFGYKGVILLLFFAVALSSWGLSYLVDPVYEAYTLVLVEQRGRPSVFKKYDQPGIPADLDPSMPPMDAIDNQAEIMVSRVVLSQTVEKLNLDKLLGLPSSEAAVGYLEARVKAKRVPNTMIVRLSVENTDPSLAAKIANTISAVFLRYSADMRRDDIAATQDFLRGRVSQLGSELQDYYDSLGALKADEGIVEVETQIKQAIASREDYQRQLDESVSRLNQLNMQISRIDDILAKPEDHIPGYKDWARNSTVESLKSEMVNLEQEYQKTLVQYTEESPQVREIEASINALKASVEKESKSSLNTDTRNPVYQQMISKEMNLNLEKLALQEKIKSLKRLLEEYNSKIAGLGKDSKSYDELVHKVRANESLYLILREKMVEAEMAQEARAMGLISIDVVDPATVPGRPIRPNRGLHLLMGCLVGLALGIGSAFLLAYWDHSLKTPADVERYLDLKVIGTIPFFRKRRKGLSLDKLPPAVLEAYRQLRSNLRQACETEGAKTLIITSADFGEGKTDVAACLAKLLAQIEGKRVLLVEGNFRNPDLARLLEVSKPAKSRGPEEASAEASESVPPTLASILRGEEHLNGTVPKPGEPHVIYSGNSVSDPTGLLESDSMLRFMDEVKSRYDYILFDSSPLIPYADAKVLGSFVDGAVLVIRSQKTRREAVLRAQEQLDRAYVRILGAVLNEVQHVIPAVIYRRL
ncbi:MAG: polysaccharide biosynthesis tyrosine autokinase [Candidatus Omnitrophica bacterium]|nr:polysaccharide biosynthesis tyrosine autokinase [Candidatus Omnitrophota bacterium]